MSGINTDEFFADAASILTVLQSAFPTPVILQVDDICGTEETDEFGMHAIENRVHVHDLHATILHLLGIDHTKLTYRYSGRDFRLTDVHGNVVHDIIS